MPIVQAEVPSTLAAACPSSGQVVARARPVLLSGAESPSDVLLNWGIGCSEECPPTERLPGHAP